MLSPLSNFWLFGLIPLHQRHDHRSPEATLPLFQNTAQRKHAGLLSQHPDVRP